MLRELGGPGDQYLDFMCLTVVDSDFGNKNGGGATHRHTFAAYSCYIDYFEASGIFGFSVEYIFCDTTPWQHTTGSGEILSAENGECYKRFAGNNIPLAIEELVKH